MQNKIQHFHKTRIAPTPSGYLHLGNAFSFAFTAALAKETGAEILLRIDDLDRERINKLYVQDTFDTLNFLGISWHQGPRSLHDYEHTWSQLYRMPVYHNILQQLKDSGSIFACQCSRTQIYECTCKEMSIPLDSANTTWRLNTNAETELKISTLKNGVIKAKLPVEMKDFVVKKKDGFPSYQLTSMADDMHYGVDLVIRGEDLWPSTIAQHYLASVLQKTDFQKITFHHHFLLIDINGNKLSKSAGASSIRYLREQGKEPAEIYAEIGSMMDTSPIMKTS